MTKKKNEITAHSSAAEYLTFIAATNAVIKKYLITTPERFRQTYRRKRKDWGYMMTVAKVAIFRNTNRFALGSLREW